MGDFNAGCSYVAPAQWASIRLRTSPAFQWLIPDTADTTSTATRCAYDRYAEMDGVTSRTALTPRFKFPKPGSVTLPQSGALAPAVGEGLPAPQPSKGLMDSSSPTVRPLADQEMGGAGRRVACPGADRDHLVRGRIVVAGAVLQHAVVPDSAAPFDFQAAYGLSNQLVRVLPFRSPGAGALARSPGTPGCLRSLHRHHSRGGRAGTTVCRAGRAPPSSPRVSPQAQAISDHYPVEVTLRRG